MPRPRRIAAILAASALSVSLAACGKHHDEDARIQRGETEGIYVKVNNLKYQVQMSRQLNPTAIEDQGYLKGIPVAERGLAPDELWFGVFLRVQNDHSEGKSHKSAALESIEIEDTQGEIYEPIALDNINVFRYEQEALGPKRLIPEQDSPAADTPIQGSLVLFKVTNASLDNRPLELKIDGPEVPSQTGIINLDV